MPSSERPRDMKATEPTLPEVWTALRARLPGLAAFAGPTEVPQEEIIRELRSLGIGSTYRTLLPQSCCYSFTWVKQRVAVICSLKVGDGRFDWVEGSGPDKHEALCRAALRALEWKEKQDAGP